MSDTHHVHAEDGFFHCDKCKHVAEPSDREIEAAEQSPSGRLVGLKCPRCHKLAVRWHEPSVRKPKPGPAPVSPERGRELCGEILKKLRGVF